MNIVFLHVGESDLPSCLVRSVRKAVQDAVIVQCTDGKTAMVAGVDRVFRYDGDSSALMTFRLEAFANLGLRNAGVYLDTDMLMVKKFCLEELLGGGDAVVCRRTFNRDVVFNTRIRNLYFGEYEGMTLDQIYPYLACFTVTRSYSFWEACAQVLAQLGEKYHFWYGDQEAIRILVARSVFNVSEVEEKNFACLPEFLSQDWQPHMVHFKDVRKESMVQFAHLLGV